MFMHQTVLQSRLKCPFIGRTYISQIVVFYFL